MVGAGVCHSTYTPPPSTKAWRSRLSLYPPTLPPRGHSFYGMRVRGAQSALGRLEPRGARRSRCVRAWRSAGRSKRPVCAMRVSEAALVSLTPSPRCRVARPKVSPETAAPLGPAYTLYPPTLQDSRLCRPSLYPPTQNPPHLPYPTHRKTQSLWRVFPRRLGERLVVKRRAKSATEQGGQALWRSRQR